MKLSYIDLLGDGRRHEIDATITTDHPASSYGQPVILLPDGEPLNLESWVLMNYAVLECSEDEKVLLQKFLEQVHWAAMAGDTWLTIGEASRQTGIPAVTLRAAVRRGEIRAKKMGRDWLLDEQDLLRWSNNRPRPGPKPKQ